MNPADGLILGLETAAGMASLALLQMSDGRLVAELSFAAGRTMAQRLVPGLQHLLAGVDAGPDDVSALAVGLGPGSFTSVRVGLATAKGMALGSDLAVIGVGSLESLAAGAPLAMRQPICAVLGAPKRHVYAALYARLGDRSNCLFGPELLPVEALAERLGTMGQPAAVVGDLAEAGRATLEAVGATFLPPVFGQPRAAVTAHLGRLSLLRGERHEAAALTPIYVLPSEAEVRLGRTFARPAGPEAPDGSR